MAHEDLINQLPHELLIMIFQAWKHSCGPGRYDLAAEWVHATWVCKTWPEVALEAAALWSSVLISHRCYIADDDFFASLGLQVDRAQGAPLDLLVAPCDEMADYELGGAFSFLLSRTKLCQGRRAELMFLALHDRHGPGRESGGNDTCEWEFTPDIFPCLRHLVLNNIVPTTSGGTPLLTLVQLEAESAYDDMQLHAGTPALEQELSTRINRFLAACPNLESLRLEACLLYPNEYHLDDRPLVQLPKLRYLYVEDSVPDLAKVLKSLRLRPSTSFHITAHGESSDGDNVVTLTIPRNVSEALPAMRHTRRLALMVGQPPPSHLSLCGSLGDGPVTASRHNQHQRPSHWSIMISDLACIHTDELRYLGLNGQRFLTHIPHLVNPSLLIELRLHFTHGLPVARDWARFFATMPHIRTLELGGGALVTAVLKALLAEDRALCGELEGLTLCVATGRVTEEARLLVLFRELVGRWLRRRVRSGTGLRSLTVRVPVERCGGSNDSVISNGELARSDGAVEQPVGFASTLRRDLVWLEDPVGRVVVEAADCPACGMEYELPLDPDQSTDDQDAEGSDEDHGGGYFY